MAESELPDVDEIEEHGKVPFAKRIAQTTAVYAVVLAIASLGGNNAMKETFLAQQQASNQWAYYQAKVIRENLYRIEHERLSLQYSSGGTSQSESAAQKLIAKHKAKEQKYAAEKREIQEAAQEFEAVRDRNQARDPYFDYAEVLLQIAIIMASVAILANAQKVFYFSLVLAGLATLLTINGYGLFVDIPFLSSSG